MFNSVPANNLQSWLVPILEYLQHNDEWCQVTILKIFENFTQNILPTDWKKINASH